MKLLITAVSLCAASGMLMAADDAQQRLQAATNTFQEIMSVPEKGIPSELLERADCVIIVPGLKKGAFIVGGKYGKGFATCREPNTKTGWSDPAALVVEGGSVGFQLGGQETDVVMLVMNQAGMNNLMKSKFTIGADASAAAGPVGRSTTADTDAYLHAQILSWSRSRGLFAGVALNGASVRPDKDANQQLYGQKLDTRQVLTGNYPMPPAARPLIAELERYSPRQGAEVNAERQQNGTSKATRRQRDQQKH